MEKRHLTQHCSLEEEPKDSLLGMERGGPRAEARVSVYQRCLAGSLKHRLLPRPRLSDLVGLR